MSAHILKRILLLCKIVCTGCNILGVNFTLSFYKSGNLHTEYFFQKIMQKVFIISPPSLEFFGLFIH